MSNRGRTAFIYHRDAGVCQYCGLRLKRSQATVDHYLAQVLGGTDEDDNLRLACQPCNNLKADRPPLEWEQMIDDHRLRERAFERQGRARQITRLELLQRCTPYWRSKHLKGAT